MKRIHSEWDSDRLKDVAGINLSSLPASTDPDYVLDYLEISNVDYYGIIDRDAIERLRYEDAPSRARRRVCKDDIVISSVRPNLQAVAFMPEERDHFVCSTGFNVVQPDGLKQFPKFAYYSLISEGARQYFDRTAKGVGYPAVDDKDFKAFEVMLPLLPEQKLISEYLDASCVVIDTAVSTKRRQLVTLDALRKAMINHVVTQGVHVNRKTQVTGVDWFPTIPTEWKVVRFKSIFKIIYRYPTYYNIDYVDEGIPEVRGEALTAEGFIRKLDDERYISPETSELFPRTQLALDDIVMSVRGTMGKIGLVDKQYVGANITANLLRLSPNHKCVSGAYLRWLMRSVYFNEALNSSAPQTTIKTITMPYLLNIRVAVPPKKEQVEIQSFLTEKMAEIDSIEVPLSQQITTLTAYRKSLIHECVTGQRRITEADLNRVKRYG